MADDVVDKPNAWKVLADQLQAMDGVTGKVGWLGNEEYPDGTPVAAVAFWNEVGVPSQSIPSRSFMRSTAMEQDAAWKTLAADISRRILTGDITPRQGMELLAIQAEGDMAHKINTITSPPLSKITLGVRKYKREGKKVTGATIGEIARKLADGTLDVSGVSDKPLVFDSILIDSLTNSVEG